MQYTFTPTEQIDFDFETSFAGDSFQHEKELTLVDNRNGLEIDVKAYFDEACTYYCPSTITNPDESTGHIKYDQLEVEAWYKDNLLQEADLPGDIYDSLELELKRNNKEW